MNIEIKKSQNPIKYQDALKFMESRLNELNEKKNNELIWILQHDEIYTAGTSYKEDEIIDKSINVIKTNRGGKITFHGPGQVIIYPILNIRKRKLNIIEYINKIEEIIIKVFKNNKITLFTKKETNRGLWTRDEKNKKDKKIIFIGLRYSKGVIYHGISINLDLSLVDFRKINPCGLEADQISSLKELNITYDKKKLVNDLKMEFISQFHLNSN